MVFFSSTQPPKSSPPHKFVVKISKPYLTGSPPPSPPSKSPLIVNPQPMKQPRYQPTFTSIIFAGNDYWGSNYQPLLSLDVAKRTDTIVKRGFEFSHNKSQEYRLSCDINIGKDGFARCRDRKVNGTNAAAAAYRHVDDTFCDGGPTKKTITRPPLVSLDEANRREKVRRRKAAQEVMTRKTVQERQARQLEREGAKKKENARLEQLENMAIEARKKEEYQRRQEAAALASAALTVVVASPKDHLVVGPTNWIVPLISLDEAEKNEKERRWKEAEDGTVQTKTQMNSVASMDHLVVNTPNGSAEVRLVSLEEAKSREDFKRQREDAQTSAKAHDLMTRRVGTGLTHVPLVTLEEARKRESSKREKVEKTEVRTKERRPSLLRYPIYPDDSDGDEDVYKGEPRWKSAAGEQEKARWHNLMSRTNSWWWKSSGGSSGFMNSSVGPNVFPDWL